jgi:alkanesulfonate monooxygenase SsuD/methylene tetrahydromethanopterin reductase-like flavin-dependent oxidoreductase (luciferase family)
MNKLDFYVFNTIHYPFIPPPEENLASWVSLSNQYFDPQVGYTVYKNALEVSASAERFGYDGTLLNEHHVTAWSLDPAPNLSAMHIVANTKHIPVGIIGNAIPLYSNPLRVAEEIAMLDVISGGRIISGFVVGTGMEYFSQPVNPAFARERFWEAHDLIIKAWTQPGPFVWEGEHYHIPNVNPWPRPLQQPHPPIWIPGLGSKDTIRKVVEHGYHYMTVFSPQWMVKQFFDEYRKLSEELGKPVSPKKLSVAVMTYVAETEKQAHREAKAHLQWLYNTGLRHPQHFHAPPGYTTKGGFKGMMALRGALPAQPDLTYEELIRDRYIIVGSAQQVAEILHEEYVEKLGIGGIIGFGTWGSMPQWMVMKGLQIAAEEVIPLFRDRDGKPDYMKVPPLVPGTNAERAAVFGKPKHPAMLKVDGLPASIDHATAHVPEIIDPSFEPAREPTTV